MNNKGFTLVEMLSVVVILGIVMGIATNGVLSYIETSKKKSEKIFVDKIENAVKSYISLNGSGISNKIGGISSSFTKCKRVTSDGSSCNNNDKVDSTAYELVGFKLSKITNRSGGSNIVQEDNMVNPKNKKKCFVGTNDSEVSLFKDSEKVYYYYVDLSGLSCDISDENKIITNIPKNLCSKLKVLDGSLKCG